MALGAPMSIGGKLSDAALVAPLGLRAPGFIHALNHAEPAARIPVWLDIGDALLAAGRWDRAVLAWERGLALAEATTATRAQASSFYWRLGQTAEGTGQLADALRWYDLAAEAFRRDQSAADEAVARMAMTRIAFHASGAGEARQHARDAVLCARAVGGELLGEALELSGEVALDLGAGDEAIAALRDAARQFAMVRLEAGGAGASSNEVRATLALAEALLEAGQLLPAVTAFESIEAYTEAHESLETRGRAAALRGLVNLELGRVAEAAEPLKEAHEWLDAAGAVLRRARLFAATARRIDARAGSAEARPHYEKAWALAKVSNDQLRIAPIGYALAKCYAIAGDHVRADEAIGQVIDHVRQIGDLEGLAHAAELGVRIAVRLAQGKLALDRLVLLARTRGQLGDRAAEVRTLRNALEASLAVPDAETPPIALEFMESLRQSGVRTLGPGEAMFIAERLAKGDLPAHAAEIASMEAERELADGRHGEAAKVFALAAGWALRAGDRWGAVDAWDRALSIAQDIGMREVDAWIVERTLAAEG